MHIHIYIYACKYVTLLLRVSVHVQVLFEDQRTVKFCRGEISGVKVRIFCSVFMKFSSLYLMVFYMKFDIYLYIQFLRNIY